MRKNQVRLTESELKQVIKEAAMKIINELTQDGGEEVPGDDIDIDKIIPYNGHAENIDDWYEAGITPDDFKLIPDKEVADFHNSEFGLTILYDDEEFGEAWLERDGLMVGNSDHDMFGGYLRVFQGYGTDGLYEDIMDKAADALLNPDEDDDDWDYDDYEDELPN